MTLRLDNLLEGITEHTKSYHHGLLQDEDKKLTLAKGGDIEQSPGRGLDVEPLSLWSPAQSYLLSNMMCVTVCRGLPTREAYLSL